MTSALTLIMYTKTKGICVFSSLRHEHCIKSLGSLKRTYKLSFTQTNISTSQCYVQSVSTRRVRITRHNVDPKKTWLPKGTWQSLELSSLTRMPQYDDLKNLSKKKLKCLKAREIGQGLSIKPTAAEHKAWASSCRHFNRKCLQIKHTSFTWTAQQRIKCGEKSSYKN